MNKKWKYCSIFLLITALLLLSTGMVSASDMDNSNTEITDNIITDTVSDNTNSISQTDNNIQSKTIQKEVEEKTDTNTTTTSNKELNKDEKNIKSLTAGTLTATPNSGIPGDTIELHLSTSSATSLSTGITYTVTAKLNDTTFLTTSQRPSASRNAYINVIVPDFEAGTYTLYLEYNYLNGRIGCSGTTEFTILNLAKDTQFSNVGIVNGEIGNTLIPITVTDTDGNALQSDSTLTFKDGQTVLLDNVPITNGVATVAVPTNRLGQYPITVLFNGNENYNPSTTDIDVNVLQANTILTVNEDDEGFYNAINTIYNTLATGKLTTTSNVAIPEAEITININGTDYTITTDDEGNFEYKYPATALAESIPITISYTGNDLYSTSNVVTGMFDVEAIELIITLDEVTLSEVNETTTISGTLTDTNNQAITNQDINLTITGINTPITVTTDSEGKFTYDHTFTQAQEVTVTASKDPSNGLYEIEDATTEFTTVIGPKRTYLTLNVGEGSDTNILIRNVQPYHDVLITNGQLVDIFNEAVSNKPLTVTINNEAIPISTDENGNFQLVYNATQGLTTYTLSVSFEGDDEYKAADKSYSGTFTTKALIITTYLDDNLNSEYLIGENVSITGHVEFEDGTYNNQEIILTINNVNYNINTDDEGRFTYTYTPATNGVLPVIATVNNNQATVTNSQSEINVVKPEVSVKLDPIDTIKVLVSKEINGKLSINLNDTGIKDTIIIIINGESITLETEDDGTFSYPFTPTIIGTNNITVTYNDEKYITTFNDSASFEVVQLKSYIHSDKLPVAVKVGNDYIFTGKLLDENANAIPNADIKIIVNDEEFITSTDNNGLYSYNHPTTTAQNNIQYEIRYSGNETYDLARNYVGSFFDVEAKQVYVSINAENTKINVPTTITGTVRDPEGNPLEEMTVLLTINEEEITLTTDNNGAFSYEFTSSDIGEYTATAKVNTQPYATVEKSVTFKVKALKSETSIVLENPIKVSPAHPTTTITATIKDSEEIPVNGGKVVFKINGITVKDENGKIIYTQVNNGIASIQYTFTETQILTNANITATYSGSTDYLSSKSESVQVTKDDLTGIATITITDITAQAGQTITITATVKDNSENINTGKLIFKINGKTIKDENGKVIYVTVKNGTGTANYTVPASYKAKVYNLTATFTSSIYDRAESQATLTIVEQENSSSAISTPKTNPKTDREPIIINNDTISEYITNNGLTALVEEGDTLDFQGTIRGVSGLSTILINKPVNIITSTNDGRIENFNEITFNRASSGTNVTGLFTYNTQFYIKNAAHIVLDNITNYVSGKVVGTNVGQTSIRENSTYITVKNSYFYTQGTQSSTLVFAWADNCIIDNCTIKGEGAVGNLLYFTYYNVNIPGNVPANKNNTVTNCTIIGPDTSQPICYTIGIAGYDITIADCNITYVGSGISRQNNAGSSGNRGETVNITLINNQLHGGCGIGNIGNVTMINNTINDNGYITTGENAKVYSNTVYGTINVYSPSSIVENNTATNVNVYSGGSLNNNIINGNVIANTSTTISNNTITGTLTSASNVQIINNTVNGQITLAISNSAVNNVAITNNTVNGNIVSNGRSGSNLNNGNNITGNTVNGNISLTNSGNTLINENNINGSVIVANTATGTTITHNNINTTNAYAISAQNRLTTISENELTANDNLGDDAINGVPGITVSDNGPAYTLNINMDTYDEYFDENGVFIGQLRDKGHVILEGPFNAVVMNFNNGNYVVKGLDENTVLTDCVIITSDNARINITNLTMTITTDSTYDSAIKVQSNNTIIKNITINMQTLENKPAIILDNVENIQITENKVTVDGGYAVDVINTKNSQITNNYLNTTEGKNMFAVKVDELSENINIEDNTPERNTVEFVEDPITGVVLDTAIFNVQLVDTVDNNIINGGLVSIFINGELLTDDQGNPVILEVVDNQIDMSELIIPSGWLRSDANITLTYTGNTIYQSAETTLELSISKRDANVEIISKEVNQNTLTLQAKITDNNELINSGLVAFKLNGCSLEDNEGNLICTEVVNGIATLEYTLKDYMLDSSYELTAVFKDDLYNRSATSETLIL